MGFIDEVRWNEQGLVPVIAQDAESGRVLMLAYMNKESLKKTIDEGKATYFSRSRQTLWTKGETSGHYQFVKDILIDCDNDAILLKVEQIGSACHTNNLSCFYRKLQDDEAAELAKEDERSSAILSDVYQVIKDRKENPKEGSYTNYLLDKGIDKILKKVGEETAEVIIGAKNNDKAEIQYEVADLLYHLNVMLFERGLTLSDVYEELAKRYK